MSLQNAKNIWNAAIYGKGGHCPCCGRFGKVYSRKINSTMAKSLIWLAKSPDWVDVPNTAPKSIVRSNQLPTLRWWGLVERKPSGDPKQKHSGIWRVTQSGRDFSNGLINLPQTVNTYAGTPVSFGGPRIKIGQCFKTYYDYQEVMNS